MEIANRVSDLCVYRYLEPFELLQKAAATLLSGIGAGNPEAKLKEELLAVARTYPAAGLLQSFNRFFQKIPANAARVQAWLDMVERHQAASAARFAAHLEQFDSVLVYSHSDLVRLSLQQARRPLSVYCTEGRPSLEGAALAEVLSVTHHRVCLFTDIAAFSAINRVDCVVLGCLGFTANGFVAKMGTAAICSSAREGGKKIYLPATSEAGLEDWRSEHLLAQGPASEIYSGSGHVIAENYCLEFVPMERIDRMFVETDENAFGR